MSDCLFCKLIQKQESKIIRFSDEFAVVIDDIDPKAPHHRLIIPKQHIPTLNDLTPADAPLIGHLFWLAAQQAVELGVAKRGWRAVFNCNLAGGQAVYHVHLHLLGGRDMRWPPG